MKKRDVLLVFFILISQLFVVVAFDPCEGITHVGGNELRIYNISDLLVENDVKWDWNNQLNVGVNVHVENKNFSNENFVLELIFINKSGDAVDFSKNSDDLIKSIHLKQNISEDIAFDFSLSESIRLGSYELYAKLYSDSETACTYLRAESWVNLTKVIIDRLDHDIILKKVIGPKDNVVNGTNVSFLIHVFNFGKFDEPKVKLRAYNSNLGLNKEFIIENLSMFETRKVHFWFLISADKLNETRKITFSTEFNYDEDKSYYKKESNLFDDKVFVIKFIEPSEDDFEIFNEKVSENINQKLNQSFEEELNKKNLELNLSLVEGYEFSDDSLNFYFYFIVGFITLLIFAIIFVIVKLTYAIY
ncbi:MAG TPA: hypothetical protein VJB35_01360 [Candidatus Nanoarchaeia archaeon]|nr:hypothetical protein [Candidatus Nanoarchaeia archaeon]